MRTKTLFLSFIVLAVVLFAAPDRVAASLIWTAQGTASDGRPDNASAVFDFTSPTSFSITLQNTAGPSQLGGISSVLDGIAFSLIGAPSSMTMTGAHAAGTVTTSTNNRDMIFYNPSGGITKTGSMPFGWSLDRNGVIWELFAGEGSFKPYGIVNSNVTATDGITNKKHNPYLDGPVTFYFDVEGLYGIPDVSSVALYFGTHPDIHYAKPVIPDNNPVPLPPALLLFGSGLIGLVVVGRRFKI